MVYLLRAAKTIFVVAVVTFGSWKLLSALEALLDHLTSADSDRNPLAGVPYYWAADAAVIGLYPLALWACFRLVRIRGNHLAVTVGFFTWLTLMLQHLDISTTGNALRFMVHVLLAAAASLLQAALMPASTRPKVPLP
ncbi:hypothetical protein GTY81_17120 [Streptomyces sp. SID8366]|uniref:hypothetical protein n=1 Tax=unclassified Streptomyces TaxID=2593676 RepID=UPI000DC236EE|nr:MULTISPECIES: hypothetical protein [unclassified Streptomyces]MYU05578.1 hypothetical protein [Streptomyces sp. SID8366]MYU63060.1 hypothetical protein [Streptomyces sp. SID69]RAJ63620.1 hypothetical protein K376_00715 [Streptomyces sp. PsTaAH-130]